MRQATANDAELRNALLWFIGCGFSRRSIASRSAWLDRNGLADDPMPRVVVQEWQWCASSAVTVTHATIARLAAAAAMSLQ